MCVFFFAGWGGGEVGGEGWWLGGWGVGGGSVWPPQARSSSPSSQPFKTQWYCQVTYHILPHTGWTCVLRMIVVGGEGSTLRWISVADRLGVNDTKILTYSRIDYRTRGVKSCHLSQLLIICCLVSTPMEGNTVISAISMLCMPCCTSGPEETQRGTHRLVRKTSALSCSFLRIVVTVVPDVQDCQIGPQLKTPVEMVLQNSGKVHAKLIHTFQMRYLMCCLRHHFSGKLHTHTLKT
jgi:hypothetical protein